MGTSGSITATSKALPLAALVYPSGVELFSQGQILEEVFLLVRGMIKLTHIDRHGRESVVRFATSSDWLGSAAAIADQPASTGAITCSKTLLRRYPVEAFRRLLYEDNQLSRTIHQAHADELCRQSKWIGQLCSSDARARLVSVILQFALNNAADVRGTSRIRMQLPVRHWELAEFIGVTREHLSRLFKELERDGVIARDKGWMVIADVRRLADERDRHASRQ